MLKGRMRGLYKKDNKRYFLGDIGRKAFLHLFHSVQKDVFLSRLNKMGENIIRTYIDKTGKYELVSKDKKEMLVRSYKCVFIGSVLDWLEEDAAYDLAALYEEICKIFAGSGERVISGQHNK